MCLNSEYQDILIKACGKNLNLPLDFTKITKEEKNKLNAIYYSLRKYLGKSNPNVRKRIDRCNLYDRFPQYTERQINDVVNSLNLNLKSLLNKIYPNGFMNNGESLSSASDKHKCSYLFRVINKKLEEVKNHNNTEFSNIRKKERENRYEEFSYCESNELCEFDGYLYNDYKKIMNEKTDAKKLNKSGRSVKTTILTDSIHHDFFINIPAYKEMPLVKQQRMLKIIKMAYYNNVTFKEKEQYLEYFYEEYPIMREKMSLAINNDEKNEIINEMVSIALETRNIFIEKNIRLIYKWAFNYKWSEIPVVDLIQEGIIGMMRAIEKFDITKGYQFSTYAVWWIRQAIKRCVDCTDRTIRIPADRMNFINKVLVTEKELFSELGKEPTYEQIADKLGTNVSNVEEAKLQAFKVDTLDRPINDDGNSTLGDFVVDKESDFTEFVHDTMIKEQILNILAELDFSDRDKAIFYMRYGIVDGTPRSLQQVGKKFGLSGERIRVIEMNMLKKLRENYKLKEIYKDFFTADKQKIMKL